MAEIINFQQARMRRDSPETGSINDFLKRASLILKYETEPIRGKLNVVGRGDLRKFFEKKITEAIIERKLIETDTFLCGIYISNLLDELVGKRTTSWWAIDYAVPESPQMLQ